MPLPVYHHRAPLQESPDAVTSIHDAVARVHKLIDEEVEKGTPPERIVIGGFSQGGAISVASGIRYPKKLGGIVCFSGWVLLKEDVDPVKDHAQKDTCALSSSIPPPA